MAEEKQNLDFGRRKRGSHDAPLKVLCLGLPRTGNHSLHLALKRLGYNGIYHLNFSGVEDPHDGEIWMAAIQAKSTGGPTLTNGDWDEILGNCEAMVGAPGSFFARELLPAYPDAKVVLNTRDMDEWFDSVLETIEPLLSQQAYPRSSRSLFRLLWTLQWDNSFITNGKRKFIEHHTLVRSLVPKEKLLEYDVRQGWEPLCQFLGKEVPKEPFPRTNGRDEVKEYLAHMQMARKERRQQKVAMVLGLSVFLVGLIWMVLYL